MQTSFQTYNVKFCQETVEVKKVNRTEKCWKSSKVLEKCIKIVGTNYTAS